jgi:hypothetical protein
VCCAASGVALEPPFLLIKPCKISHIELIEMATQALQSSLIAPSRQFKGHLAQQRHAMKPHAVRVITPSNDSDRVH